METFLWSLFLAGIFLFFLHVGFFFLSHYFPEHEFSKKVVWACRFGVTAFALSLGLLDLLHIVPLYRTVASLVVTFILNIGLYLTVEREKIRHPDQSHMDFSARVKVHIITTLLTPFIALIILD